MSKTLDRITVQAYAGNAIEYSVDSEPVSLSQPLSHDKAHSPFYSEKPVIRPLDASGPDEFATAEHWVQYEVMEFHTGAIHYARNADDADRLAYQIAQAYLLGILIQVGKLP